jgi:hypothetical protein
MTAAAMPLERDRVRRRVLVVSILIIAYVFMWAPDVRRAFGHPLGEIGVSLNPSGVVTAVAPNAYNAGVRVGDTIDWQRMSSRDRLMLAIDERTLNPGTAMTIPVVRAGRAVTANVVAAPEPAAAIRSAVLRFAFTVLFTALGALLVMRRPSAATWAFFIYALNAAGPPTNVVDLVGPTWYMALASDVVITLAGAMNWGLVVFAILLLREGTLPQWRRVALAATAVLVATTFAAQTASTLTALLGTPSAAAAWIYQALNVLPFLVAACILAATSAESSPEIRQRLRWVIAGMVCATIASGIAFGSTQFGLGLYPLTYAQFSWALIVAALAVGSTVTYAILKHRIIDVNVAISRALAYTLISAAVVGAFAIVELFFARAFSEGRAGLFADIGLALILGFFFNAMHARVDRFVDGLLFRSRHLAEAHLETVVRAMPYAKSREHVERLLTEEPARAFRLRSTRLVPVGDGAIECELENPDSLAAYLEADRGALRLGEHGYGSAWSIAIGIFAHRALTAIVLYGPHRDDTDLDGDEVALLERLADAAGSAYERLEAEELRARVAVLEAQVGS